VERYGSLLGHIILNPCQPDSDILNVLLRSSKYQFDIIWFDTTGEHSLYDRCGCVRHLVLYCLKHIFTISLYNCYRLCHIHVAVAHILSVNVACCHLSVYERIFFTISWQYSMYHFESITVATMTWLTVMKNLYHKWPRICSTCRKHFPALFSFMTYHRVCN
jgi:hypothetical protein